MGCRVCDNRREFIVSRRASLNRYRLDEKCVPFRRKLSSPPGEIKMKENFPRATVPSPPPPFGPLTEWIINVGGERGVKSFAETWLICVRRTTKSHCWKFIMMILARRIFHVYEFTSFINPDTRREIFLRCYNVAEFDDLYWWFVKKAFWLHCVKTGDTLRRTFRLRQYKNINLTVMNAKRFLRKYFWT